MPVLGDNCFDLVAIKKWMLARNGVVPPGVEASTGAPEGGGNNTPISDERNVGTDKGTGFYGPGDVLRASNDASLQDPEDETADFGSDQDPGSDKYWWDKESKKYQARLRELDYRKRLGELIERVRVEDEFIARVHAVKKALIAFERALPPELIACRTEREMSEVIRKAVRNVLENFSRPLPQDISNQTATVSQLSVQNAQERDNG
jgi:hypothetical protein